MNEFELEWDVLKGLTAKNLAAFLDERFPEFEQSLHGYVGFEESGDHRPVSAMRTLRGASVEGIVSYMAVQDVAAMFSGRVSAMEVGDSLELVCAPDDLKMREFLDALETVQLNGEFLGRKFKLAMVGLLLRAKNDKKLRNLLFKPKGGGR
jgi:hypothetical protein